MKTKYIITVLIITVIISAFFTIGTQAEVYGDKTCTLGELFPGMPVYFCMNPDGGMDHSFFTYESMNNYYVPPLDETPIDPPVIYVYGAPSGTYTYSGN